MSKIRVIKEKVGREMRYLEESVIVKAEVAGGIYSEKEIVIEVRHDISGGIGAPNAEVIVKGGWTKNIEIAGGVTAKKLAVNHANVCGSVKAEHIKILNSKVWGAVEGKEVKLRNAVVTATVKANDLFW